MLDIYSSIRMIKKLKVWYRYFWKIFEKNDDFYLEIFQLLNKNLIATLTDHELDIYMGE